MPEGTPAKEPTLAEEIKRTEDLFIDAAVDGFRRNMEAEYCRLRGYAVEAGREQISLSVTVTLGFNPANRFVIVETAPNFVPQRMSSHVVIPNPA
jgi:hypothetical protein